MTRTELELEHATMVHNLAKPGGAIVAQLTSDGAHLWHMVTGVSGEAGELLDAVKKHVAYGKPLDRVNVVEELGDIEFYMQGLREGLGITREETLVANVRKLLKGPKARYSEGSYSDAQAQARQDKDGPKPLGDILGANLSATDVRNDRI